ncbi:MAG TPA: ammonium transporter [Acidimicrobiales bacterium]|nr:ammonium transporter [Acidimicrobiales bacterium]
MHLNDGDTAWLLVSSALVLFMTPGLAFFYGGLVRSKHVLATIMQSFVAIAVVTILWVLVGFSLAFGPDVGHVIGNLQWFGLRGVGAAPGPYGSTVPATAYMVFQMMFAIITPALIAGAFAERMKFSGYLVFISLWSLVIYAPVAHWEWGGGFLGSNGLGALDFAGGAVVHANAGAAALATALYLGKRRGYPGDGFTPHNIPMVVLGASMLWFGWFGFNAGSAITAGGLASSAFVNTQIGACAACLAWLAVERVKTGKATVIGGASGAVAGLAAITPASGYVPPWASIIIGAAAGILCYLGIWLKTRFKYDDSLDVVAVHMVGGVIGVVLTGAFASLIINAAGAGASLSQVAKQLGLVGTTVAFSFVGTMVLLKLTDITVGLRVSPEEEDLGLDLSQHGEVAYQPWFNLADLTGANGSAKPATNGGTGAVKPAVAAEASD